MKSLLLLLGYGFDHLLLHLIMNVIEQLKALILFGRPILSYREALWLDSCQLSNNDFALNSARVDQTRRSSS